MNQTVRVSAPHLDLPEEIRFLQGTLPHAVLANAADKAGFAGVSADRVLIGEGVLSETAFYQALAAHTGCGFEHGDFERNDWQNFDRAFLAKAVMAGQIPSGMIPLASRKGQPQAFVAAPKGTQIIRLLHLSQRDKTAASRITLVSPSQLIHALQDVLREAANARASSFLKRFNPALSASTRLTRRQELTGIGLLLAMAGLLVLAPKLFFALLASLFSIMFFCHMLLKIFSLKSVKSPPPPEPLMDRALPRYGVLVPLMKEGQAVIGQLREALLALDYPREKLQIFLIMEGDDPMTQEAVASYNWPPEFQTITIAPGTPRTKPKAMNVALAYVNAPFLTIYDAEDIPDPNQLRLAAARFAAEPKTACLQARLSFFNARSNWLTAQFAVEYASLFDHMLPRFEALGLPLPLGGTSNHFRTRALRDAGAWDPYNVTEDADLGVRLKGLGFETAILDSETQEEATSRYLPWHRQRTRWQKGWLQTWLVHMRSPVKLYRTLGFASFMGLQAYIGGLILAPIAHLLLVVTLVFSLTPLGGGLIEAEKSWQFFIFIAGYSASFALAIKAAWQRDWWLLLWLPTLPLYWLLASFAAINSFFDLARRPYFWAKTPHGFRLKKTLAEPEAAPKTSPKSPANTVN